MNNRGFITADFMFSIVLLFGMTAILFAMTFSLTMASITQYITFAAARNYVTAHRSESKQRDQAIKKYKQLIGNKVFSPMYRNGWFDVAKSPDVGDISILIQGYKPSGQDPNLFWGVGTQFTAKILDINIPFFGSTNPDSGDGGKGFKTYMGSYLGRDPTMDECITFVRGRWDAIQALPVSGGAPYSTAQGQYQPLMDDGC